MGKNMNAMVDLLHRKDLFRVQYKFFTLNLQITLKFIMWRKQQGRRSK